MISILYLFLQVIVILLCCFPRHEDSDDNTDIEKMELEDVSYEAGWMIVCHVQADKVIPS